MGAGRTRGKGGNGEAVEGFPPVFRRDARVLILGTMPGVASLQRRRYYAHPHNAFWPIMGALFGAGQERPYDERLALLRMHGIALWDVAHRCRRTGSLDADIDCASIVPNRVASLLCRAPRLRTVFFNGGEAERLFRRLVLPGLGEGAAVLRLVRLPSTSPAHAARSRADKLRAWRVVARALAKP